MARDIAQLHPRLQEKIQTLRKECSNQGLKIGISECFRTVEEQNALYAQGRIIPGIKVTNAKGTTYNSMHQWGIAFDFFRNDGMGAFVDSDGFFYKVGRIGQRVGLEWGGTWTSIHDKPHFQLPDWGSTARQLKDTYGTPDKFIRTWNHNKEVVKNPFREPDTVLKYDAAKATVVSEEVKWLQWELRQAGYEIVVDGKFGPNTDKILKDYQKKSGLVADGISGNNTKNKLKA